MEEKKNTSAVRTRSQLGNATFSRFRFLVSRVGFCEQKDRQTAAEILVHTVREIQRWSMRRFARTLDLRWWFGAWAKRDLQSLNAGSERRRLNTKKLGSAARTINFVVCCV